MYKVNKFPIGSVVDFKMTLCPTINAPVSQGKLVRYCRVPGCQSVIIRGENNNIIHYPVQLAVVELSDGSTVRVDAKGILGVHKGECYALVPTSNGTSLVPVSQ